MATDNLIQATFEARGASIHEAFASSKVSDGIAEHGVVLLRGFAWDTAMLDHASGELGEIRAANVHWVTSRRRLSKAGAESVDIGKASIPLHSESYYTPICPQILVFACEKTTAVGGATTLCDGSRLWKLLAGDLQAALRECTIRWHYECSFARLEAQTHRPVAEFREWCSRREACTLVVDEKRRKLSVDYAAPAVRRTWWSGEEAFANNLISLARSGVLGSWAPELDPQVVDAVAKTAESITIDHEWRAQDVVLIDNTRFLHGRREWSGGSREIQVRMLTVEPLLPFESNPQRSAHKRGLISSFRRRR